MTRTTVALPGPLFSELCRWLDSSDEVAGVLTAKVVQDDVGTTLFARSLEAARPESYLSRHREGLELRSTGWLPRVRLARGDRAMALFVHTHPRGRAEFSRRDDAVDDALSEAFIEHTGQDLYGSLVVAGEPEAPTIAGRLRRTDGHGVPVDTVRIAGEGIRLIQTACVDQQPGEAFDRQVRALGSTGQATLGALRIGVVGTGGTGSAVGEQLLRLGVGHLVVIDDDVVTPPTVTRGYGTGIGDVGRPKVDVLVDLAERIGFGARVSAVKGNLRHREVALALRHCDVLFSCVDGHAGRIVLNRWAYYHLAPVVDVGVLVSSTAGVVKSIDARLTWLAPGTACLLCRGRIDPNLAYAEQLDPDERRRLAAQGYAPELAEPEPSVVPYTTLIASWATTELLHRLFGLADVAPTELLLRLTERSVRLNRRAPREGCFCSDREQWGAATAEPYLGLLWRN